MSIRKVLEEQEKKNLAPYATLSTSTKGREKPDEECEIRMAFQHDRDRIIHSKAFRRLKHKTQVFLAPSGDHYRTRLTHTLEVAQVARTIARALGLNEDLTEAIALGHDLGHTPFGHAGEKTLNKIYRNGFKHPVQSLRVVEHIEKEGEGLNLTFEVRDGILKHSKGAGHIIAKNKEDLPCTLEGQIVRISDRVAYIAHDIDDALRSGVFKFEQLPKAEIRFLGERHSQRINKMVLDVIQSSQKTLPEEISLSSEVIEAMEAIKRFLYKHLYYNKLTHNEFKKVHKVLNDIYYYCLEHHDEIPAEFSRSYKQADSSTLSDVSEEQRELMTCDFVAGMTDRYALKKYEEIFFPKPWRVM